MIFLSPPTRTNTLLYKCLIHRLQDMIVKRKVAEVSFYLWRAPASNDTNLVAMAPLGSSVGL